MSTRARARAFQTVPSLLTTDSDWIARSTASGVVLADRLNTATKLVAGSINASRWVLNDGLQDHISLDTTLYPTGSSGSWKFRVLNSDGSNSGNVGVYFGNIRTFSEGDTVWFSFRQRGPATFVYQPWPVPDPSNGGQKYAILSWSQSSSMPNEVVPFNWQSNGIISGYHQNGDGGFPPEEIAFASPCDASDTRGSPAIDWGLNTPPAGLNYPLTGNDPDTGSAWSACAQGRRRYGGLRYPRVTTSTSYRPGFGDPLTGAQRMTPDTWVTITVRVQVGTWHTASTRLTMWTAQEGQPYVKVYDTRNAQVGNVGAIPYDVLWLLPYVTSRTSGGKKVGSRTNNVTGAEILVVGLSCPLGVGLLEYNASTGRFRWSGSGETFGTARGFSAANNILTINVTSGTATNSYVVLKVTPAALPTSGIVTDSITIADGRPDTQTNYADVVISTQAINAPGGYPPIGVSTLADAAASMAVGTWSELTVSNQQAVLGDTNPGGEGSDLGYSNAACYIPQTDRIQLICADHGGFWTMNINEFDLATNSFVEIAAGSQVEADTSPGTGPGHGYDHASVNPYTGDAYQIHYASSSTIFLKVMKRTLGATSFATQLPNGTFTAVNITFGSCWWSGSFTAGSGAGAQGCLFIYNGGYGTPGGAAGDGNVQCYDPVAGTWIYNTIGASPFSAVSGATYQGVAEYSEVHNCAVYGGLNSVPNKLWRMSSNGTVTAMPDFPGSSGVGIQRGNFVCDPVSGNFLVLGAGELWELNPTGSGTWTQQTGGRVPPGAVGWVGTPNFEPMMSVGLKPYGVIAYITQLIGSGSGSSFYLYKHA